MKSLRASDPEFIDKVRPFFSLLEKYFRYEVRHLNRIPPRNALVVMNHGIIPYHGFLLAKKLMDKGMFPRGLGAEFLFRVPGLREFFLKGGAVNASPENARRLLQDDQVVLLAPGGIYEALIAKKGLGRIPWERRMGFVKIAVETKTPIIPTYCRGINSVYFNSYFLLKARIKLLEKTRFSLPFFFGLGVLPLPRKLIHVVGEPIRVARKGHESKAKQIARVHDEVIEAMTRLAMGQDEGEEGHER